MTPITIEPARADHFVRLNGRPPALTSRAIAAVRGDEVLGIAGVYPKGEYLAMFFDRKDELTKHRRVIVRGIRRVMEIAKRVGVPIVAKADPAIAGSASMLEHMGFKPYTGEIFIWRR